MKHCINCGTKLEPDDIYCPECGTKIEGTAKYEPGRDYAGLMIRLLALGVDLIVLGVIVVMIRTATGLMSPPSIKWGILLFIPYSTLTVARKGSTLGKRLFNLKITHTNGDKVGYWASFIRACSIFLSLIIFGLGILWIGIDSKKQGLHDKIADTVVVRVKE